MIVIIKVHPIWNYTIYFPQLIQSIRRNTKMTSIERWGDYSRIEGYVYKSFKSYPIYHRYVKTDEPDGSPST